MTVTKVITPASHPWITMFGTLGLILLAIAVFILGNNHSSRISGVEKRIETLETKVAALQAAATTKPAAPAITAPPQPTSPTLAELKALGVVHLGNGNEHSLIRELRAYPKFFGFKGDENNKRAVKKWAQRDAHLIATRAGYFDWKFGAQIGVRHPDEVSIVLMKNDDGTLRIDEYTRASSDDDFGSSPENSRKLSTHYSNSVFMGWPDSHVPIPDYLYLFTG